jgi:excinuclease UvrABC nuclease subunit
MKKYMTEKLQTKLSELPKEPGVYFHKDAKGEIIYVGKAAVLRNRVRQYFQASRGRDPKTEALVEEIVDVDWMVVESELEALFLEAEMIRRYMPRSAILWSVFQYLCCTRSFKTAAQGFSVRDTARAGAEACESALSSRARSGAGGRENQP